MFCSAFRVTFSDGGDNFSDTTATDSDTPREADHSTGSPPALNNYQQLTTTPANAGDNGTPVGGDGLREDELLAIRDSRTKEDHREEGVEEEPGIFGRKGLLAVRHVKVLLFLACVTQVCDGTPPECFCTWPVRHLDGAAGISVSTVRVLSCFWYGAPSKLYHNHVDLYGRPKEIDSGRRCSDVVLVSYCNCLVPEASLSPPVRDGHG